MRWSEDICPISHDEALETSSPSGDFAEIMCPVCGRFRMSKSAIEEMRREDDESIRVAALERAKRDAKPRTIPYVSSLKM